MDVDPSQLLTQLRLVIEQELRDVRETTHEIQLGMVRLEGHIVHRVEFDTHKEATREAIDRVKTASINGDDAIKIKVEANAKDIVTLATKVKTWGAAVAILISLISIASRFI